MPIIAFASLGIAQGISQLSYHLNLERAIRSYRFEPPLCFIFNTPPTLSERLIRVIDSYQIDANYKVYLVSVYFQEGEETGVCVCKTKTYASREWYKGVSYVYPLDENKTSIEIDEKTYIFKIVKPSGKEKNDLLKTKKCMSGQKDEIIVVES